MEGKKKEKRKLITKEDMLNALNIAYEKSKDGIKHVSPPVEDVAEKYLSRYKTKEKAAKAMLNTQVVKCTTSGFITGFGGVITLPVTIPANIGSVLYVQMRMIACVAYMGGWDLNEDEVQTFVYACLAGVSVNEIIKKFGVDFGTKLSTALIKKIPGEVLININKRLGFRFLTKFGEKGLINLGKLVPVAGAVINGGFDLVETKIIANRAYKMFVVKDFSDGDEDKGFEEEILDADYVEVIEPEDVAEA